MGYMHIENLYKSPEFLACFALEKIHGTSAHVGYRAGSLALFAGGVSHAAFAALFDGPALAAAFAARFAPERKVVVYGEAFGGKCQGMSETYGKELRFLAFDVQIDEVWLDVKAAAGLVAELGLGFVPYEGGPLTLEFLDAQRDRPSLVSPFPGKIREGIVVRPVRELMHKDGRRVIAKHKRDEFRETHTVRSSDPAALAVLSDATAIAEEWVTPMRLEHVLQRVPFAGDADILAVIIAMQEDVQREGAGEIAWSKPALAAVGRATVALLRRVAASDATWRPA